MNDRREVLVVRPEPGASETVEQLQLAGMAARALPLLERRPLPETPPMRRLIQDLDAFAAVIFVSPAAADFGMRMIDRYWPQFPSPRCWIAVGVRTRAQLEVWGVGAVASPSDERSEGMLALPELQALNERRVLIVRGQGGRDLLRETLQQRGARVDVLEVYQRVPLQRPLPAAETVAAVVVSSGAVLDALVASGGEAFRDRVLVVPSERVAVAAEAAGFRCVICAEAARSSATVDAVRSCLNREPDTGATR